MSAAAYHLTITELPHSMESNCCIFPDDLVEEILSRLPVKDLLRARCVSKRWCGLIDDVSFIRKHYQVQYSFRRLDDNMAYFVDHFNKQDSDRVEFHLLSILQQGDAALTVDLNADLERDSNAALPYGLGCFGCVNGIICLSSRRLLTMDSFLALWNPATREFKTLAYPNDPSLTNYYYTQLQIDGFGFDPSSSDFKILAGYIIRNDHDPCSVETHRILYSLKSNSWKWISNPLAPAHDWGLLPGGYYDRYLNGVSYWVTNLVQEGSGCLINFVIVSFNFIAEVFKVSELPPDALSLVSESGAPFDKKVMLYKERLALAMIFKVREEASYDIHIWVATQLDDCGVPLSWQHLFNIIGPTRAKFGLYVDTILMNGDFQLVCKYGDGDADSEDYLYIHSSGEFKKFDIWWKAWFRYVESLFPLSSKRQLVQT